MNELDSLKSLLKRGFVTMEQRNPFLMKILAVMNMDHSNSHILMEDAKRGLGSTAIAGKCAYVRYGVPLFYLSLSLYTPSLKLTTHKINRTYDVKGLPHRRTKTSETPFEERTLPKTGIDGDFYAEEQDKIFQKMTGEQCTSFQEGLLDVINFLVSPDESYENQMIDFSFLFTIATGCEGIAASDSVCTTQGEFGCFVVDESNLIAVSVIDYLNNFNRFKRMESTMSMGAANQKFHRYNRYTSDFVRSLCDPSGNDDDASSTSSELSSSLSTLSAESLSTLSAESGSSSDRRSGDASSMDDEFYSISESMAGMDEEEPNDKEGTPLLRKNK